jgi:hypothetical protein
MKLSLALAWENGLVCRVVDSRIAGSDRSPDASRARSVRIRDAVRSGKFAPDPLRHHHRLEESVGYGAIPVNRLGWLRRLADMARRRQLAAPASVWHNGSRRDGAHGGWPRVGWLCTRDRDPIVGNNPISSRVARAPSGAGNRRGTKVLCDSCGVVGSWACC